MEVIETREHNPGDLVVTQASAFPQSKGQLAFPSGIRTQTHSPGETKSLGLSFIHTSSQMLLCGGF